MKLIHTGDIHYGMRPDADRPWGPERAEAVRSSLRKLVDTARQEEADLLLIAGDLFHRQPLLRDLKEVSYLFSTIPDTQIVIIAGNHDRIRESSAVLSYTWPDNVFYFTGETLSGVYYPKLNTEIRGFSYHTREITEELLKGISASDPVEITVKEEPVVEDRYAAFRNLEADGPETDGTGAAEFETGAAESGAGTAESGTRTVEPGIGTAEPGAGAAESEAGAVEPGVGAAEGRPEENSPENARIRILMAHGGDPKHLPIDYTDLARAGFSYCALGHIHKPQVMNTAGIVFCGSPEPLDMTESGPHGCYVCVINDRTHLTESIEFRALSEIQYISLVAEVTTSSTNTELSMELEKEIRRRGERNIYRLKLRGMRDPDLTFDLSDVRKKYRISEFLDETEPKYDFSRLFAEHPSDMIGFFVQTLDKPDMSELDRKALCYGVRALLETQEERSGG